MRRRLGRRGSCSEVVSSITSSSVTALGSQRVGVVSGRETIGLWRTTIASSLAARHRGRGLLQRLGGACDAASPRPKVFCAASAMHFQTSGGERFSAMTSGVRCSSASLGSNAPLDRPCASISAITAGGASLTHSCGGTCLTTSSALVSPSAMARPRMSPIQRRPAADAVPPTVVRFAASAASASSSTRRSTRGARRAPTAAPLRARSRASGGRS